MKEEIEKFEEIKERKGKNRKNLGLQRLRSFYGILLEGSVADLEELVAVAEAKKNIRVIHIERSLDKLFIVPEKRLEEAFILAKRTVLDEIAGGAK